MRLLYLASFLIYDLLWILLLILFPKIMQNMVINQFRLTMFFLR